MGGSGWAAGDYLDRPLRELLEDVADADPVPAAGSVVAVLGALAAGLAAKVARRSTSQVPDTESIAERADWLRGRLEPLITADAASYTEALAAAGNPHLRLKSRFSRSPARLPSLAGIVVRVSLPRTSPFIPARRMRRSTVCLDTPGNPLRVSHAVIF